MECRNCPLIKSEFDMKINHYHEGLYNWYDGCSEKFITEDIEQGCYCDKIECKVRYEQCSDAFDTVSPKIINSRRRKRNKRERDLKYKQRLKFLAEYVQCYPCPVTYTDEIWIKGQGYVENPKPYYKRLYRGRGGGCSSQHKKVSNRKVRRYKGEIHNGSQYKKIYDYWWEMY